MTSAEKDVQDRAKRLRDALQRKNGGNASELARYANLVPQSVSKWLYGTQFPRDEALRLAAEFLNVTPEYLKFGTPTVRPPPTADTLILMYVKPLEARLLTNFRESTEQGQRQMMISSTHAEKLSSEKLPDKGAASD
ncbi:helix-turn-helix transcriptional regulator [Massilia sp. CCM 8734]|uniref:helix-turn-helix domain-containing protein n=2 Tax=Massilia TaxID=149698 RepID=UPI0014218936|nr:helix-turn-helix transcriptional regulator [Massilia sp. CCM 8734]NIA01009.1 helix-turn-helix domain-containing protein [Massilia sp. CCM 8734]